MAEVRPGSNRLDSLAFAMDFILWAQSLHDFPSVKLICQRWGVGRASAYRYRQSYADALKIPVPANPEHGVVANDYRSRNQ